jgi:thioredoxin reductase (NADPH)
VNIDVQMCIVVLDPHPVPAAEIARSLANWIGGDCRVIRAATPDEALTTLDKFKESKPVILAAKDVGGGQTGLEFLKKLKANKELGPKLRLRGLLTTDPQDPGDDGIVRFWGRPGTDDMMYHFVHLLRSGGTDVGRVTVKGDKNSKRMHRVKRFLVLNRVPFDEVSESGEDVQVKVGYAAEETNPSPLKLAKMLNFVPEGSNGATGAYHLIVVGGGPAGLAAAVCASGMGLRTLVLEDDYVGGQAGTSINRIENYFGFPGGVAAPDLVHRGLNQAFNLKSVFIPGLEVTRVDRYEETVTISGEQKQAKRFKVSWKTDSGESDGPGETGSANSSLLVIASGRTPRRVIPKGNEYAPNEDKFVNRGIYYDALPKDAESVDDKNIAIVGAGDTAGRAALLFGHAGAKVTMIVRGGFSMSDELLNAIKNFKGKGSITIKKGWKITNFVGNAQGQLEKVVITTTVGAPKQAELPVDKVYALTGGDASTGWLKPKPEAAADGREQVTPALDDMGFVKTEVSNGVSKKPLPMQTSVPGVFAIGDVRSPGLVQRVAQAAGQGAAVAVSIDLYLRATKPRLVDETSPAFAFYEPSAFDQRAEQPASTAGTI